MTLKEYYALCSKAFRMDADDEFFKQLRAYVVQIRKALIQEFENADFLSNLGSSMELPYQADRVVQEMQKFIKKHS